MRKEPKHQTPHQNYIDAMRVAASEDARQMKLDVKINNLNDLLQDPVTDKRIKSAIVRLFMELAKIAIANSDRKLVDMSQMINSYEGTSSGITVASKEPESSGQSKISFNLKNEFFSRKFRELGPALGSVGLREACGQLFELQNNFSTLEHNALVEILKNAESELSALASIGQLYVTPSKNICDKVKIDIYEVFKESTNSQIQQIIDKKFKPKQHKGQIIPTEGKLTKKSEPTNQNRFWEVGKVIAGELVGLALEITKNTEVSKSNYSGEINENSYVCNELGHVYDGTYIVGRGHYLKISGLHKGAKLIVEAGGCVEISHIYQGADFEFKPGSIYKVGWTGVEES